MRKLDFYEFTGIFLPGALFLLGLSFEYRSVKEVLMTPGFLPAAGFVVLSYAAGHIIQVVGNIWEEAWWRVRGGMPTDWLLTKKECYSDRWRRTVLREFGGDQEPSRKEWKDIVREIYGNLRSAGRTERIDIFNGNYGMFRGFCAATLSVMMVTFFWGLPSPKHIFVYCVILGSSTYRMDRFGRKYAKEMFAQYTSLLSNNRKSGANQNTVSHST